MVWFKLSISALCVWCIVNNVVANRYCDRKCAPRDYGNGSVVCVCDEYYYDTITRECGVPLGEYRSYVSSKSGLRFDKDSGSFYPLSEKSEECISISIFTEEAFQTIHGFGTSVTDAAGSNWVCLPKSVREAMIESYFGPTGLEFNIIRTPIGGCDFSTRAYTYQDSPPDEKCLSKFALTYEDYSFKIPMIRAALQASCGNVQVMASCWSPPPWMKTNENITGRGFLKNDYYQTYADYHLKYIEAYWKQGIPIYSVTTTNEPFNGLFGIAPFNCLGWTPKSMGKWIAENLGPTLCNSPYDVKIICGDDQRFLLPMYANEMFLQVPEVLDYVDGIAVHWYGNFLTPPSLYNYVSRKYPDKYIICTEACEGFITGDVSLGSWKRAQTYCSAIITDLIYGLVGWIDWNLCLNEHGGPNWVDNYVDSAIIVFNQEGEFVKQPMFYALGHFSKWIPRGSSRINVDYEPILCLELVAFRTPEQNIVVVLQNSDSEELEICLTVGCQETELSLIGNSITTIEFPFCNEYFGVRRGYVRPCPPRRCQLCRSNPYADCGCFSKCGGYSQFDFIEESG